MSEHGNWAVIDDADWLKTRWNGLKMTNRTPRHISAATPHSVNNRCRRKLLVHKKCRCSHI